MSRSAAVREVAPVLTSTFSSGLGLVVGVVAARLFDPHAVGVNAVALRWGSTPSR
jgi:O-antigen/teichoic acid export membrane protein